MADILKISVPGKPEYVGVVRLAVSSAASAAGFDIEDIEDIKVAVTEICTHVFCHHENPVTYEVSCELAESGITISIDDVEEEKEEKRHQLSPCSCYPVEIPFIQDLFDPATSLLMLRTLMDEVDIFSNLAGKEETRQTPYTMIRMSKFF